jgi:hypothetical protein
LQRLEPNEQASCPCLVGGLRGCDRHRQQQPERVHQHMAFPPLDLFASVIAFDATGFFRGLDTLAVHDRRRGVGVAARPEAHRAAQRLVDALPHPAQAPLAKGRIGRLPWRILAREIAPGTAGAQDVEQRVDEQPQWPGAGPAAPCWHRQQRRQLRPLGIGQITKIQDGSRHGRAGHKEFFSL